MADPPVGPVSSVRDPGAEAPALPVVRVLAEATIEAAPELAEFCVTVAGRARGHWETLDSVTRRSEECLALLSAYGPAIEQMRASPLRVSPELHGPGDKVRWYRGEARTRFAVSDFSVLGELMSRLSQLEPVVVEGPRWRLRADSPVHHEVLERAVRAAMTRGGEYAQAAGGRLARLLELADLALTAGAGAGAGAAGAVPGRHAGPGTAMPPQPVPGMAAMDLEPVPQTVHASVAARFAMTHPASLEVPAP
jgi:uncharacterized protein